MTHPLDKIREALVLLKSYYDNALLANNVPFPAIHPIDEYFQALAELEKAGEGEMSEEFKNLWKDKFFMDFPWVNPASSSIPGFTFRDFWKEVIALERVQIKRETLEGVVSIVKHSLNPKAYCSKYYDIPDELSCERCLIDRQLAELEKKEEGNNAETV